MLTYQEFIAKYGKRLPDIVYEVCQRDTESETLKAVGEWLWTQVERNSVLSSAARKMRAGKKPWNEV